MGNSLRMFENAGKFPCFDISLWINPNFACNENDDGVAANKLQKKQPDGNRDEYGK